MEGSKQLSLAENELSRLEKLSSLKLELGDLQDRLLPFVELARSVTQSPLCEINILGSFYQWTVSGNYKEMKVIPREQSICNDTIRLDRVYEINNLTESDLYKDRSYVKGDPHLKYYCGVPLKTSDDKNIGSLCVLDTESRHLNEAQIQQLEYISDAVMDLLEHESQVMTLTNHLEEMAGDIRTLNHDIRTPVNGIIGLSELMAPEVQEDKQTNLKQIIQAARAINYKIEGVLDKISSRYLPDTERDHTQTEISDIVPKVNSLYQPLATKKRLTLNVEAHLPDNLLVSKQFMITVVQITGNLISNSLKFTDQKGKVNTRFTVDDSDDEPSLHVQVSDTGTGMSSDQVKQFQSGNMIDRKEGTAGEQSFGIGLQHVRQLVESLNGSIEVESELGEGTVFRVELPLIS